MPELLISLTNDDSRPLGQHEFNGAPAFLLLCCAHRLCPLIDGHLLLLCALLKIIATASFASLRISTGISLMLPASHDFGPVEIFFTAYKHILPRQNFR